MLFNWTPSNKDSFLAGEKQSIDEVQFNPEMELCAAKERYDTKFVVKCSPVVFINKIKPKFRDSAKLEKENRGEMFYLT